MRKVALGLVALLVAGGLYAWWGLPSRAAVKALARENPGLTAVMRQRE